MGIDGPDSAGPGGFLVYNQGMKHRGLRALLWMMLAVLVIAQTEAVTPDPENPTPQPTSTEQVEEPESYPTAETTQPATKTSSAPTTPNASPTLTAPTTTRAKPLSASNLALPSGADIVVIPISGMIYDFTLISLERRVDMAIDSGASLIVIELDTPGGVVTSALKISKYIKGLSVPTVAWVHNEAYSAGILLSAACDEIVMSPVSSTGDCAPVIMGGNLAPTERAKILSPILEEFRDSARANGYDYAMFHAMCVLGVELYLVEKNDGSGERRLVNQVDYEVMVKGKSTSEVKPQVATAVTGNTTPGAAATQPAAGTVAIDVGAPSLTVTDAERGLWIGVEVLPSGDKAPGGQIHDGTTLLTLNQTRAQDIGLSKATLISDQAIKQHYQAANIAAIPVTWSEGVAAVLTSWWMRAILVVVFLLGAYIELQAPGLSIPGAIAGLALLALVGAPFMIGLAEVWHILMFLIGFILVIIEIVFLPSFGLLGIGGLMMMFLGVVLAVVPTGSGFDGAGPGWLPPPEMQGQLVASMFTTLLALLASGVGFYYITKHFGKIPGLNRLILSTEQPSGDGVGVDVTGRKIHVSGDEVLGGGTAQVGMAGETTCDLRPSGTAKFGEQIIDVVSVGPFIAAGQPVKITEVHGNRIVVDEA